MEMLIVSQHDGADLEGATADDDSRQGNRNSLAIKVPEHLFGLFIKTIIRRDIYHHIPKGMEFLAHQRVPKPTPHLAPHDATNRQVRACGGKREPP